METCKQMVDELKELGVKQTDIAEICGLSNGQISNILAGKRTMRELDPEQRAKLKAKLAAVRRAAKRKIAA